MVLPYININPPQVYMCSPSWTLLPPPSPYHPSGSPQCTSPKHPVSCIEPGLATRFIYGIIHVSMPFSQIIPPSPSPRESKRLFYTSVCLFLSFLNPQFLSEFSFPSTSGWGNFHHKLSSCWWLMKDCLLGSSLLHLRRTSSGTGYVTTPVSWDDIFQNENELTLIFFKILRYIIKLTESLTCGCLF